MNTPTCHRAPWSRPVLLAGLTLLAATYLLPLAYMVLRSLLGGGAATPTLANYRTLLEAAPFAGYLANSVIVLVAVVGCNVVFSVVVGYAFARYRFRGRELLFYGILITLMIPKQALAVPVLDLMVRLGLHDTLWALILPFAVDSFNIYLIRQYLEALPIDLEEAARADGASEWAIVRHVVGPLCRPVLAVVVINTAIVTWNSFLFPLILTDRPSLRTLPVGLSMIVQGPHSTDWGVLMAGATLSSLPLVVLFLICQRQIIDGITAGALKD